MEALNENYKLLDLFSTNFESKPNDYGVVFVRNIEIIKSVRQVVESEIVDTYMPDGTL